MDALAKLLEKIAVDLVTADPDDLPSLAKIHESLLDLGKSASGKVDLAPEIAVACAELIEKIMLGDVDKEKAITVLNDGISGLQAIIRDKRHPSEVCLPDELELALSESAKKDSAIEIVVDESSKETDSADPIADETSSDSSDVNSEPESFIISFDETDTDLLPDFLNESKEHCTIAEQMMMDLETGSDYSSSIDAIFRSFHTIKGGSDLMALKPVTVLAHELEALLDLARKQTLTIEGRSADIVFEAIDVMRTLLDKIEEGLSTGTEIDGTPIIADMLKVLREFRANPTDASGDDRGSRVGDILVNMGAITQKEIDDALANKEDSSERLGETLVKQGAVKAKAVAYALRDQKHAAAEKGKAVTSVVKEMVKIDTERLDSLIDTIGELVIAESMVGQDEEFLSTISPKIAKNVSHLNKITRELQEMGMALRLVPVRPTFQKLARAVRDLTRQSGKKVELTASGEDSEVDRSIVENIGDPLLHMIRNSVDHAIEVPSERSAAGKSETGHIWLRAYHKGGNIYFDIEDDGRGLDREKILSKARDRGLIDGNKELSDREIFNLILQPGFSTAMKVTKISGRGVGMDVVKRNIDAMRGHLEIDSSPGEGTRFTMKLPLTLAIIDGMLVRIANERYIVPTVSVVESVNLTPDMIRTIGKRWEMVNLRGNMLPLIRTSTLFGLSDRIRVEDEAVVVVVEDGDKQIGLVVDELLGKRQTVIKSLGPVFMQSKWVSGGAILSDGSVGLIIDISGISELANRLERETSEAVSRLASANDQPVEDSAADDDQPGESNGMAEQESKMEEPEAVPVQ